MSTIYLRGSCFCGATSYTSTAPCDHIGDCFCVTCRGRHAAAFATYARFPRSAITFAREDSLETLRDSEIARRYRCSTCKSLIGMAYLCTPEDLHISASTIDESTLKEPLPKTGSHIFVAQKPSWYTIADDIPQYEFFNPEFKEKLDRWEWLRNDGK